MLVPLHGFLQGDTLGLLLLVQDGDTLAHVARTLIDAAAVRVAPVLHARVFHAGVELPLTATVAGAGLAALDRIDLVPDGGEPAPAPSASCSQSVPVLPQLRCAGEGRVEPGQMGISAFGASSAPARSAS